MENKKEFTTLTLAEKFAEVARILSVAKAPDEVVEFMNERSEQVAKRNKNRKPSQSKTNKEKLADMEKISEWFFEQANPETFYSSQEICDVLEFDYTPQKMTSRLKALVDNGTIEKGKATSDKKKVGYKIK